MLNINQAKLISNNNKFLKINSYIPEKDFFITFLSHLKDFFAQQNKELTFSAPYFNELGYTSDSSYIHVDDIEFGQIFYLTDNQTNEITFFLYSEPLNVKYYLLEDDLYRTVDFGRYSFFLESIYGFFSTLLTEMEAESL